MAMEIPIVDMFGTPINPGDVFIHAAVDGRPLILVWAVLLEYSDQKLHYMAAWDNFEDARRYYFTTKFNPHVHKKLYVVPPEVVPEKIKAWRKKFGV